MLFGPVTSVVNSKIAQAVTLLLVNHMLGCSSSRQAISGS